MKLTQRRRAYIYRVAVAVLPLLVATGIIADALVPTVIAVIGAVLVPGLAAVNTTTKEGDGA